MLYPTELRGQTSELTIIERLVQATRCRNRPSFDQLRMGWFRPTSQRWQERRAPALQGFERLRVTEYAGHYSES